MATRLFGIRFEEKKGITTWHPDVRVFQVLNADGSERGLFLGDYFARTSKRSGAWMSALQSSHKLDAGQKPIIYNVMNFAKPKAGEPALLSLDDARTLFHEFGHALHGLLSDVTWPAVSGTAVSRDFVELPSQLYEHWLTVPAVLEKYAVHYRTGEAMPKALLDKVLAARSFNAGFNTVEFTSSALVDMAFHTGKEKIADPLAFEAATLKNCRCLMPSLCVTARHISPTSSPAMATQPATIPTCGRKCWMPMHSRHLKKPAMPSTRNSQQSSSNISILPVAAVIRKSFTKPSAARCRRRMR